MLVHVLNAEMQPEHCLPSSMLQLATSILAEDIAETCCLYHFLTQAYTGITWSNRSTCFCKVQLFCIIVLSTLLYGCDCLTVPDKHMHQMEVFQMRCLHFICGVTLFDHKPNVQTRHECFNQPSNVSEPRCRRPSWLGHLGRMPNDRPFRQLLFSQVSDRRLPFKKWP